MTCHGQLSPQEDRRFESLHRRVCEPSPVGPQAITSLAVQVRNGLSAGGRWIRTCMGLFLSSGCLGCADSFLFGAGKAVFRPVAWDQVRGARGRGQGTETVAQLGGLPPSLTSPIRPAVPEISPGKSLNGKERG